MQSDSTRSGLIRGARCIAGAVTLCATAAAHATLEGEPWVMHTIAPGSAAFWGADGVRLGDIDGDGDLDAVTGSESSAATFVFFNPGPGAAVTSAWQSVQVGNTPDVEDAFFVDLDGDGRLDVVSSQESGKGSNPQGEIGMHFSPTSGDLTNAGNWTTYNVPAASHVEEWIYSDAAQIDGANGLDIFIGGKYESLNLTAPSSTLTQLGWLQAGSGNPRTNPNNWTYHKIDDAGWIMTVASHDMDGDGDMDALISDRAGTDKSVRWLENPTVNPNGKTVTGLWASHDIGDIGGQPGFVEVGDLNGDGMNDVVVVDITSTLKWYERNNAAGTEWTEHSIPYPDPFGQGKAVAIADVNRDGLIDLVLSCKSLHTDEPGLIWLENTGTATTPAWLAHDLSGAAAYGKWDNIQLIDLDGDGDLDAISTEEQRNTYGFGVVWFENPTPVPTPEPGSLCIAGCGALFLFKRRR